MCSLFFHHHGLSHEVCSADAWANNHIGVMSIKQMKKKALLFEKKFCYPSHIGKICSSTDRVKMEKLCD